MPSPGSISDGVRVRAARGARPVRGRRLALRPLIVAAGLLAALGLGGALPAALAAGRVALVVGNGTYAAIGALPNPGNDAADMASALGRLGFDVTTVRDADLAGMNESLRLFARESAGADVAVVFYAGHGLEVDGVNYLVPVDARLERDTDVSYEALALDRVLQATSGAALRVVILDACRNNPLARSMQRTGAARSVSRGSFGELDEALLGEETLVAYAAAAGTTAADGDGRNSPYTTALLSYLEQPLELSALFRRVRAQVLEATDGEQRPHEYGSLLGEHYLGGASGPGTVTVAEGLSATVRAQQENLFWQSIVNSTNAGDYEAYLRQFPAGTFRALATNRLAALRSATGDPPASRPAADRPPRREAGTVFRDCPTCPELVVVPAGRFRMGCVSGRDCQVRRGAGARGGGVGVRAGRVRGDVRGVRPLRPGHAPRPTERPGLGPRRPAGDQRVVGGRDCLRSVALGGDGGGVPAAE